ncbi:MAG: hypothetical protein R3254_09015, partial [Thiomicrorhabdus sp.]|nr:hypothetical protein [Thiomicrorhabdus sp.]
ALQNNQLDEFYQACHDYQYWMNELGVNDTTLQNLIDAMRSCPSISAAKISGSGLGDCVLGVGTLNTCPQSTEQQLKPYQKISINISAHGAFTEKSAPQKA